MENRSVRIPESRIREHYQTALGIMANAETVDSAPQPRQMGRIRYVSPLGSGAGATTRRRQRTDFEAALSQDGDALLSPERHAILFETRRALAVGLAISEYFVEPLGYLDLGARNKAGTLHGSDLDRFRALVRAKALVAAFAAAAHLFAARAAPPTGETKPLGDVPDGSSTESLGWLVSRLATAVRGVSDEDIDEVVARLTADAMDAIEDAAHTAMGADIPAFEAVAYAVDEDDFHLRGFDRPGSGVKRRKVAIPFKKPHEVVGNHIAKAQALKLARMLVSYDFEARKNPFVELGGFIFTVMGDGYPGTGKTTLIQMIAGLLAAYCEMADYPFRFENFGIDQISEYQGKSAQNCKAFIDRVLDPRAIGFGTIDDIDQVAGKRDDQRSSGGQQEVTAVLMESFAGTGTVVRGNCAFGMFSNYPEKVDDALRQRAGARWLVDGPQTRDDYIDIFHLLLGTNHDIPLGEHDLYAAQQLKRMVERNYRRHSEPQERGLREVFDDVLADIGVPDTIADIGDYLYRIKEREPRFTGRAIKNITDAIKYRAMDVDLPDEWFENPEPFLHQPYARKLAMIGELRRPITLEMVMQEINRYADSEFRYSGKTDEAAISAQVREMKIRMAATERFRRQYGNGG